MIRLIFVVIFLCITALIVLLNHIKLPEVTIAIDGSLYEHHPKYHGHMMELVSKWVPKTKVSDDYIAF